MPEFKDLWVYTENDKGLRILLAIIFALIIVFAIWLWFKAFIVKPKTLSQTTPISNETPNASVRSLSKQDSVASYVKPEKGTSKVKKSAVVRKDTAETKQKSPPVNISQQGKNNVAIGRDNFGDIHNGDTYHKPPQRILQQDELNQIISLIPSKDYTVKVSANGSLESKNFQTQILQALHQNGYADLRIVQIGMEQGFFGEGRLTIRPGKYGDQKWIEVIVNPQE